MCRDRIIAQHEIQQMETCSLRFASYLANCLYVHIPGNHASAQSYSTDACAKQQYILIVNCRVRVVICLDLDKVTEHMYQIFKTPHSHLDPWTYMGPKGGYEFSNYRNPSIKPNWLATFLLTCLGDISDAIATQGFRPDEPHSDGTYNCHLDYVFPSGSRGDFALEITNIEPPDWYMTFSDIVDDLEALWYAALRFEKRAAGVPEMDFNVYQFDQQSSDARGSSFLASRGNFSFALIGEADVGNA